MKSNCGSRWLGQAAPNWILMSCWVGSTTSEKQGDGEREKNIWHVIGDASHMFISNGGCIIDIPNWFLTSWRVNTVQTIRRSMTTTIKCSNWQNLFLAPPYSYIWLDINYYGNVYHAYWVIPIKFDHDDDDNTKDWIPLLEVHLLVFLPPSKSPPFPLFRDGLNEQPKNYEFAFFNFFFWVFI